MSVISRGVRYLRTNGPTSTMSRVLTQLKRLQYWGKHVVYYCDLPVGPPRAENILIVEVLDAEDRTKIHRVLTHWDEVAATKAVAERFRLGAQLWLAKKDSELVAYGWTIRGKTVSTYFFPLAATDVHLFDFVVFPEFRGKGINSNFVERILGQLSQTGERRAFIECLAWNEAQLRSLSRTPFKRFGVGRKLGFCGRTASLWSPRQ